MKLYSLIAVSWDNQEGCWYPVASVSSCVPFQVNGTLAFRRRLEPLYPMGLNIMMQKWEYNPPDEPRILVAQAGVIVLGIHNWEQYSEESIRRYISTELTNDLQVGVS